MADKIPVYGELDCRTAENIIADAEQIRYDTTKNVKEKIAEIESSSSAPSLVYYNAYCSQVNDDSTVRYITRFSFVVQSNISTSVFIKSITSKFCVLGTYEIITVATGMSDMYTIVYIESDNTNQSLKITFLDRDGSTSEISIPYSIFSFSSFIP